MLEKEAGFADHQNQRLVDGMPAEDVTKLLGLVDELLELAQKRYHEIQDENHRHCARLAGRPTF